MGDRGTKIIKEQKMILISIANNSKSFANGSKSIIRKNIGLCKRSEIYFIQNFQKHCQGFNGMKTQIWQGKIYQTN